MKRHRPTPEEANYGQEKFNLGYSKGYTRAFWDMSKIKKKKEKSSFRRFGKIWDKLDDALALNRKK